MEKHEDIEKVFEGLGIDDEPRDNHKDRLRWEMLKTFNSSKMQAGKYKWSIIMNSRITKYAAAAMVLIAVGLLMTLMEKTTTPVYAVEQTIRAIGDLTTLHVAGIHIGEKGVLSEVEIWTRAHSQNLRRSGDFREEVKNKRISVVSEEKNVTYRYYPEENQVNIMTGLQNSVKPFWPDGDFFRELKENAIDWQEILTKDKDGNDCISVTCSYYLDRLPDRYFMFWFEFDPETMLPLSMKIRDLSKKRGSQEYSFDVIEFNQPLPEHIFEFNIPEGAKVIDER